MKRKLLHLCLSLLLIATFDTKIVLSEEFTSEEGIHQKLSENGFLLENGEYSGENYVYNNGGAYLDTATVPQGVIVTGSSGQIRPLQASIIKDTQYAFLYVVSDPYILAVDEKGNWQALKAGSVTLEITFPASGQIQNFEDELDALGI